MMDDSESGPSGLPSYCTARAPRLWDSNSRLVVPKLGARTTEARRPGKRKLQRCQSGDERIRKTAKWKPPAISSAKKERIPHSDSDDSDSHHVVASRGRRSGTVVLKGEPLNTGAFGVVCKGDFIRADGTTVEVAVKRLILDTVSLSLIDPDAVRRKLLRRLQREFLVWEKLDHPNVVPILGWIAKLDKVCLISPWCNAGNLRSYLHSHEDADYLKLLHGVIKGLAYLHQLDEQLVHGDMSLENVLVGDDGRAMLIDFGLSSYPELGIETSMAPHGNQRYIPPERVLAEDEPEHGSRPKRYPSGDVWSFAFVAHHIVTGKMPWQNVSPANVVGKLAKGKPPKSERLNKRVPRLSAEHPWWDELDRCWSVEPEDRPTMVELDSLMSSIRETNEA